MSLLDAFDAPCTRRDVSDYGIDEPIMDGPYGSAADHALTAEPAERAQFHAAVYGHAAGTCQTCDTVRESGVFARNGRRPMTRGNFRPVGIPAGPYDQETQ